MKQKIVQLPDNYNGILIVGEAPGKDEAKSVRYNEKLDCYVGKPFIGAEGRYLRVCCQTVGFPFEECAVINTVHEHPSGDVYGTLPSYVISEGIEELRSTINKLKPKLIIAIGNKSLEALTEKSGITKFRGTILPCTLVEGYRVFATIHPGFIFKGNPQHDIVLKMDLKKAFDEFNKPSAEPDYNIEVLYNEHDAVKRLYDSCYLPQLLAVDIETGGPRLLSFGVATTTRDAFVIPRELCRKVNVLRAISEFCDSNAKILFHNGLYDAYYLAYHYNIFTRNYCEDSMYAQHAIFPSLPKSLAFCSSLYTRAPYWKDEGKEVTKDYSVNKIVDWPAFYLYNGKDCCVTLEVFEKQQEELDYWDVRWIYRLMMDEVEHALISQYEGSVVNWENVKAFADINEKAIENIEKLNQGLIGGVNCNSPKQVKELLYEKWRLPPRKYKGKLTTNDKAIKYLEALPTSAQPLIGIIKKTRELVKLRGYYNIKVASDGKVHWGNKITGTNTGRWATSGDIVTDSGMNYQNQPKAVRNFYDAPPGDIFIEWDLSNVDARFVAAICGDENWLKSFDIIDNHSFNAVQIYKIEPYYSVISKLPFEVDKLIEFKNNNGDFLAEMYAKVRERYDGDKSYRDGAKKVGHATNYLEGPSSLSLQLGCSMNMAKALIKQYQSIRPSLTAWHDRVTKEVGKSRVIRTFSGRVMQFFGPSFTWAQQVPSAVAAEPQSSAGDYLMIGGLKALQQIEEIRFSLQVHDSIRVLCKNDLGLLKTVMPSIKKLVEFPVVVNGIEMSIPSDFKIGTNWGGLKDVKDFNKIEEVYRELS